MSLKIKTINAVKEFTREIIGTIAEIVGFENIILTDTNLEGEKLVMVDVEIAGQETERMFCSKAVSLNLRNKEITAGELMNLPIALVETEDGRQFYQLQMPSRESNQLKLAKDKAKKPKTRKSVAKFEELVAY